jgi:DNA-directed RNA polymerase subunit M/transcription elongation factor TFIIS
MVTQVRACPKCSKLMWVKSEDIEYPDENTMRFACPHCQEIVRFRLIVEGSNADGPKMGH